MSHLLLEPKAIVLMLQIGCEAPPSGRDGNTGATSTLDCMQITSEMKHGVPANDADHTALDLSL